MLRHPTDTDTEDAPLHLEVVRACNPADVGATAPLGQHQLFLGRESGCSLVIDDPGVSRRHASLERMPDGGWLVSDLSSTNGLYVNGRRVTAARLAAGDELRLGPTATMRLARGAGPGDGRGTRLTPRPDQGAQWTYDLDSARMTWSGAIDTLLSLPPGALSGTPQTLEALFTPEDGARLRTALERAAEGTPFGLEVQLRNAGRHLELRAERLTPTTGVTRTIRGAAWDITARQQASLKLRHHAALFESFSDPVGLLDLDGRVLDCNRALLRLLAVEKDALLGRTLDQPDNPGWTAIALARVRRCGRYESDWHQMNVPGKGMVCEAVVTPLLDASSAPLGFVVVYRDVTETRDLHARLAQADRLSALGTLSAGIAHEINNPLAYLRANLEHIHDSVASHGAHDDLEEAARDCAEGVERIARIVRDLKFFSRVSSNEVVPTSVASALSLATKMVEPMIKGRAELSVEIAAVPLVRADEARLAQVVLNLLINAAQAMPDQRAQGNRISVAVRPSGDGVLLEVADNGMGMTPEVLRRVFDPFFTTKPVGIGTGLGLSICHGIIEDFGGTISARSTPGVGTTFSVWLARSEDQHSSGGGNQASATRAPALKLLLVDDDPRVLKSLARMLGSSHHVSCALDAAEALAIVHADGGFDLVLCDVLMPIMTGLELYDRLLAEAPAVSERLVFMTGGGLSVALQNRLQQTGRTVLEKPLDHARLFQLLEARALARPQHSKPGDETLGRLRLVR